MPKRDLNKIPVNKKAKRIATQFVHNRLFLTVLIVLAQLGALIPFILNLNQYLLSTFFGINIVLSFVFMVYLTNCKGKNEFKMAWLIPTLIFPLFGICAYFLYHANWGGFTFKKKILQINKISKNLTPKYEDPSPIFEANPEIRDIGTYLHQTENYFPHTNCNLEYFKNGETLLPDFLEELDNAKEYIFMEYFIIDLDETWLNILEILERKAKEGVEVRIMYDSFGTLIFSSSKYQKMLAEKGIKSRIFLKVVPLFLTNLNNRDHRKITIIDGKVAYTGGINLENKYFNAAPHKYKYWKDIAIKIKGSAIQNLTELFLHNWNLETKEKDDFEKYIFRDYESFENKSVVIPYGDDAYNEEDIAENVYEYILNKSYKYVHIMTPYLIVDNQMVDTLSFAAKRGVDVSIIVPHVPDHIIAFCIGKIYQKILMDAGVKIYVYKKGFIHAKSFVSDNKIASIGSINLDYRSFYHHFESNTLIYNDEVINDMEKDFQQCILEDCELLTPETYKKIPWWQKLVGYIFKIFGPLM